MKIVIYNNDEREFISKEIGKLYTRNLYEAAAFETMTEAETYLVTNFPCANVSFLTVVQEW